MSEHTWDRKPVAPAQRGTFGNILYVSEDAARGTANAWTMRAAAQLRKDLGRDPTESEIAERRKIDWGTGIAAWNRRGMDMDAIESAVAATYSPELRAVGSVIPAVKVDV